MALFRWVFRRPQQCQNRNRSDLRVPWNPPNRAAASVRGSPEASRPRALAGRHRAAQNACAMKEQVRRYMERHELLRAGDRVGVAVSGGPDSVTLLRLLLELREELGLVLSVVHFNHRIRGAEADEDERFVRELAQNFGLECHVGSADVPAHAARSGLSLETAARALRYDFFRATAEAQRLNAVATGHTRDDQAETVLMNLVRGAGTQGLAGIFPSRPLGAQAQVVRPLLAVGRAELLEYLRALGQAWREDASNRDLKHTRNRVRHEVLPHLMELNPRLAETLADTAERARAEQRYWDERVAALAPAVVRECAAEGEARSWSVAVDALRPHPLALQRRILHHGIALELEFDDVEAVLDLAGGALGRERDLHHGYVAARLRREVIVRPAAAVQEYEVTLPLPGSIPVPALGMRFKAIFQEVEAGNSGYNRARFLEPRSLPSPLVVRNWRPGDRFWPAHAKSPQKVKRLLQERRVTGVERALWPVVASGEEIVWLRGFGASQSHRAAGGRGIVIEEVPLERAAETERPH